MKITFETFWTETSAHCCTCYLEDLQERRNIYLLMYMFRHAQGNFAVTHSYFKLLTVQFSFLFAVRIFLLLFYLYFTTRFITSRRFVSGTFVCMNFRVDCTIYREFILCSNGFKSELILVRSCAKCAMNHLLFF